MVSDGSNSDTIEPLVTGDPRHVGIIMDGNGRWARARGLSRPLGHERGVEVVRAIVDAARDFGIECLTLYSFSTENWKRPETEVNALFSLLRLYVSRDLKRLKENGVRIRVIGSRNGLPEDVCGLIDKAQTETCDNSDFDLCIAFNYGGREEIVRAFAKLSGDIQAGRFDAASVNENLLASYLDTAGMPDPDLIIRTGGEMRLSNFLVWQATYSELLFSDILWPDYSASDLKAAIETYRTRARRFGGVLTEQI